MFDLSLEAAGWITAILRALATLSGAVVWAFRRSRAFTAKVDGGLDSLVGRPDMVHPDTGEVLVPATPGLGPRLATIEATLVELAETHALLTALTARVDRVEARVD